MGLLGAWGVEPVHMAAAGLALGATSVAVSALLARSLSGSLVEASRNLKETTETVERLVNTETVTTLVRFATTKSDPPSGFNFTDTYRMVADVKETCQSLHAAVPHNAAVHALLDKVFAVQLEVLDKLIASSSPGAGAGGGADTGGVPRLEAPRTLPTAGVRKAPGSARLIEDISDSSDEDEASALHGGRAIAATRLGARSLPVEWLKALQHGIGEHLQHVRLTAQHVRVSSETAANMLDKLPTAVRHMSSTLQRTMVVGAVVLAFLVLAILVGLAVLRSQHAAMPTCPA